MNVIHEATAPDATRIRLVERSARPHHVLIVDDGRLVGIHIISNNRDQAVRAFVRMVEIANAA